MESLKAFLSQSHLIFSSKDRQSMEVPTFEKETFETILVWVPISWTPSKEPLRRESSIHCSITQTPSRIISSEWWAFQLWVLNLGDHNSIHQEILPLAQCPGPFHKLNIWYLQKSLKSPWRICFLARLHSTWRKILESFQAQKLLQTNSAIYVSWNWQGKEQLHPFRCAVYFWSLRFQVEKHLAEEP